MLGITGMPFSSNFSPIFNGYLNMGDKRSIRIIDNDIAAQNTQLRGFHVVAVGSGSKCTAYPGQFLLLYQRESARTVESQTSVPSAW
jgi:hypothetical protein